MEKTINELSHIFGGYVPTPEQWEFIKCIAFGNGNCIGKGVAGCGKSKTMEMSLKVWHEGHPYGKSAYLVFNKRQKEEFEPRMKSIKSCNVMTMHGYGFKAIAAYARQHGIVMPKHAVDGKKYKEYLQNHVCELSTIYQIEWDAPTQSEYRSNVLELLDKSMLNLLTYESADEEFERMVDMYDIDIMADEVEVTKKLLKMAAIIPDLSKEGCLNFTDMIYLACTNESISKLLPTYNVAVGDECQDFNACTQKMLKMATRNGGKWVAVGDPKQAINGFAGSLCDSYDKLYEAADNHFELTYNFRCGKAICELAAEIVPELKAWEGAKEGEVVHTNTLTDIKLGDLVLCRKTAPIIKLCLRYLAKGISASVVGNDIADGIAKLIISVCKGKKKTRGSRGRYANKITDCTIAEVLIYLDEELQKLKEAQLKAGYKDNSPVVETLTDKIEIVKAIAECDGVYTPDDIVTKLRNVTKEIQSGDESLYIRLSSIHRAKGAEADNCFILLPNKLPLVWDGQKEWQYEQEVNLKYVAITRAKKRLVWVDADEKNLPNLPID